MEGILIKKISGCDFDIEDFNENDFEVHGSGWVGILTKKT
jgi:hypothetical protein